MSWLHHGLGHPLVREECLRGSVCSHREYPKYRLLCLLELTEGRRRAAIAALSGAYRHCGSEGDVPSVRL